MLKLTKLFFALSLIAFMSACSNDDDASSSTELEGTWKAVSFSLNTNTSTEVMGSTVESVVTALGSNFDYSLVFTSAAFTTSGGYDLETSGSTAGQAITPMTSSYSDVDGAGTYTTSGNEMTVNGSFFTFDFNGVPYTGSNGPQTVNYEINSNDQLVFTQDETTTTTTSGTTVTATVTSSSTWEKQ